MSEELKLLPCPFCGCNPVPPTSNYITVRCAWCGYEIPTEKWNRRSIPELPRVSPENLVEGEWYVVKECVKSSVEFLRAGVDYGGERGFPVAAEAGRPTEFLEAKDMFAIWGPIPEFELAD